MIAFIFATGTLHNKPLIKMRRDVFQAIADPTRRNIINVIAHESLTLNSVAQRFDISRQAVSKHIKILNECGLIIIRQQGREHYCHAKLEKLNEVAVWVEQYRKIWEERFDSLDSIVEELKAKQKKPGRKK
ncbi:MAG: ArsR family transcriptional regulator [Chitinophagaceae bacterium]|nr:ArsR family transcriptional regulator [Chitinophagaceae bacterium]